MVLLEMPKGTYFNGKEASSLVLVPFPLERMTAEIEKQIIEKVTFFSMLFMVGGFYSTGLRHDLCYHLPREICVNYIDGSNELIKFYIPSHVKWRKFQWKIKR